MTDAATRGVRKITYADGSTATLCPRHGSEEVVCTKTNRSRLVTTATGTRWTVQWECPICHAIWEE